MKEHIELLEKSIIEGLPQIPYIIDQAGAAMNWVKEEKTEAEYLKILEQAVNVVKYATKVSEPNFFKTHLVLASLLQEIPNAQYDEKFAIFKTASGAIEATLNNITVDSNLSEERGCFKAVTMQMVNIARTNEDDFVVMLYGVLSDLQEIVQGMALAGVKAPITPEDYIKVVGYAFVMANLRLSDLHLLDSTREVINEIEIILNNNFNF